MTNAIFYLKKSSANINRLVGEINAMEVESSRVKLPIPVAHGWQWASNASSFAARSVDMLLDVFSTFLEKSTEDCKKVCPARQAIMRHDGPSDYVIAETS